MDILSVPAQRFGHPRLHCGRDRPAHMRMLNPHAGFGEPRDENPSVKEELSRWQTPGGRSSLHGPPSILNVVCLTERKRSSAASSHPRSSALKRLFKKASCLQTDPFGEIGGLAPLNLSSLILSPCLMRILRRQEEILASCWGTFRHVEVPAMV